MWLRDRHESAINLCNRRTKEKKRGGKKKPKKKKKGRTNHARLCKTKRPSNKSDHRAPPSTQWESRGDFGLSLNSQEGSANTKEGREVEQWEEIYADFLYDCHTGTDPLPSPSRSQWIKHSIGAGAPGRQWWYFWNSTVRLKYLTVYLPLPRFLLTRAHGRFAVSVLSFVKIIHEALLPFRYDEESIVSIFTLPPFSPRPFFEKTNPSIVLDVLVNLIWDDVNELPSCGGASEEFSFSSIGRCYKFFRNEFFFCTEIRIWFKYNIIRRRNGRFFGKISRIKRWEIEWEIVI